MHVKTAGGFSPLKVLLNCLDRQLWNVMVIPPFAPSIRDKYMEQESADAVHMSLNPMIRLD